MDRIHIRDILVRCVIGIDDDERRERQDVLINITLHADLSPACRSDSFADALDYRAVKQRVVALVETSQFYLVEALAEAIANECLGFDLVQEVDVTLDKPGALRFARSVAVEISRRRHESV